MITENKCPTCKRKIPNRLTKILAGVIIAFGIFGGYMVGISIYLLITGGFN